MKKVLIVTDYHTEEFITVLDENVDVEKFFCDWIEKEEQESLFDELEFHEGGCITVNKHCSDPHCSEVNISGDNGVKTLSVRLTYVED